ncbi:MAG TPA: right-handed parallel beta-helix repeat-containing protein [Thermoanaerobaculia bacterium]|nr:right-handed parallel beta-helix repeat-containing protein [Thermoanaerobaculia bacterium]
MAEQSGISRRIAPLDDLGLAVLAFLISIPLSAQTRAADEAAARERGASVPAETALLLAGKPFPSPAAAPTRLPEPRRTFFVAPGPENGDGSEKRPWNDLPTALRALEPGDRLRLRAGRYAGPVAIDEACRDGRAASPIQVVFDKKAVLEAPDSGAALTLRRAHWHLVGVLVELADSEATGIALEAGAREVTLEGARVAGGTGPGIRVGPGVAGARIETARVSKSRVEHPGPASIGIQVLAGSANVVVAGNRLHENPAGSLRVEAPGPDERPAREIVIEGNAIYDDDSTEIRVAAADGLRVIGNTISDQAGRRDTRGVVLERVSHAVVRSNHVERCALGLQIGRAGAGAENHPAEDVTIDHNVIENTPGSGTAIAIEAGNGIRFVNNLVSDCANGILVLGAPPETRNVIAANNILLGVTGTALRLSDSSSVSEFDYNVFAPAGASVVEVAGQREALVRWVKANLPHSAVVPRARMLGHDVARIEGVPTVDRGRRIDGVAFLGAAPDIGVAEK